MNEQFAIQSAQYQFPYHYLVDIQQQEFSKNLGWGLDYYTYMKKAMQLVKKYAQDDILDIGCGDGFLLNNLMREPEMQRFQAVGIDIDEKPIKFAQAFATDLPNTTFLCEDIFQYERQFQLISCVETLEHIPDDIISAFVKRIAELLLPGGTLVVSVPSVNTPLNKKHFRHYDGPLLKSYFPDFEALEEHFISKKNTRLYKGIQFLLCNRHLNLNFSPFRDVLLGIHQNSMTDGTPNNCGHVMMVFKKSV
uniref:Class I SAM-dependent methyltransferase n=1 Tax=Roseihalotalea indica TaxID=2867963 RepID=A0AA49JEE1_9BACT|nr:class I SAM-dependent methyltransferase [Tunicatimonas sp. TK19036]